MYNRAANPKSYRSNLSDLLCASPVATIFCVNLLHTRYMHRHRLQKEVLFDEGGESSKYMTLYTCISAYVTLDLYIWYVCLLAQGSSLLI